MQHEDVEKLDECQSCGEILKYEWETDTCKSCLAKQKDVIHKTGTVNMTVKMNVTIGQALTLQAMFEAWNKLSSMGHSQFVAFLVDGDGNFHPNCEVSTDKRIPELTDELRKLASDEEWKKFDFDNIAWKLHDM